ncbi:methyltransferase domain-containing protein [Blastococcus sp. SYSU DS0973]
MTRARVPSDLVTTYGAMTPIRSVRPSADGLTYEVQAVGERVVDVLLDGRRVWSFRAAGPDPAAGVEGWQGFEPWPTALAPHLSGTFAVALRDVASGRLSPEVEFSFDGDAAPLTLADRHGRPLVVNKWGRLGRALADADNGMVGRLLDSLTAVRELLQTRLGDRVYVTGGSLLGPVREDGHVLPHDDDADLAYLSRLSHPADVTLESFELGRLLRSAGYEVLRLSVAHLQVVVSHEGVPDHYVDVFTGFLLDDHWYQHIPLRVPAVGAEDLLPPVPVHIEDRTEPAPKNPEMVLAALYGPGWRSPDPSFTFEIPPATADRFYGWFADYNVEREQWEDEVLLAPVEPRPGAAASAFGRWVDARTPAGEPLLELGCGLGADALALGAAGRTVRAVDFSRYAVDIARAALADRQVDATVEVLNLLDIRAVVRLGAQVAATPGPWTVFGRRLLNALEDRGRDNVFRLCGMLLRRGGAAYFDLVADTAHPGIALHRHLSLDQVVDEAARYGLVLDEALGAVERVAWFGAPEERSTQMWRMTFRRRTP